MGECFGLAIKGRDEASTVSPRSSGPSRSPMVLGKDRPGPSVERAGLSRAAGVLYGLGRLTESAGRVTGPPRPSPRSAMAPRCRSARRGTPEGLGSALRARTDGPRLPPSQLSPPARSKPLEVACVGPSSSATRRSRRRRSRAHGGGKGVPRVQIGPPRSRRLSRPALAMARAVAALNRRISGWRPVGAAAKGEVRRAGMGARRSRPPPHPIRSQKGGSPCRRWRQPPAIRTATQRQPRPCWQT